MEKYVIFSIDNVSDVRTLAKFLHHMDVQKAMMYMQGNLVMCHGSYKGQIETSFICHRTDFDKLVEPYGFVSNQESILRVSECNKQYATLEYLPTRRLESIGSLKSVSKKEAMKQDA